VTGARLRLGRAVNAPLTDSLPLGPQAESVSHRRIRCDTTRGQSAIPVAGERREPDSHLTPEVRDLATFVSPKFAESFSRCAGFSFRKAGNMKMNVGSADRWVRGLSALALLSCSVWAPLPLAIRLTTFGGLAAYMLFTALSGTCVGYALMGKSTCPKALRP